MLALQTAGRAQALTHMADLLKTKQVFYALTRRMWQTASRRGCPALTDADATARGRQPCLLRQVAARDPVGLVQQRMTPQRPAHHADIGPMGVIAVIFEARWRGGFDCTLCIKAAARSSCAAARKPFKQQGRGIRQEGGVRGLPQDCMQRLYHAPKPRS